MRRPTLSVIVPALHCASTLARCLRALRGSAPAPGSWEVIVVDDGSTDDTAVVAERMADRVVRIADGPRGPAAARNRGAAVATGEVLVFVDADVCVAPDALWRFEERFAGDPALTAAFGAYDLAPEAPAFVSQYRNLLHHYVHATGAGLAVTFWAGCGAVRAADFRAAGGFDERRFRRPQIEDVELGYRLAAAGARIRLDPDIQGKHLKRWTWRGGVVTDVRDRGVPWMLLLLERGEVASAGPLNLQRREKVLTAVAAAALPLGVGGAALGSVALLGAGAGALAVVLVGNAPVLRWFARTRGTGFAICVAPLRIQYYWLNAWSAAWAAAVHLRRDRRAGRRPGRAPPAISSHR
jgi:hypothetical protein